MTDYYKILPEVKTTRSLPLERSYFNNINNLYYLCAEQTLADVIYNATGEPKVYALTLNELLAAAEALNYTKQTLVYTERGSKKVMPEKELESSFLGETITLKLKNKMNFYKKEALYEEYKNELVTYMHEMKDYQKEIDGENLLYILNPDENNKEVDEYTKKRIDYTLKFVKN